MTRRARPASTSPASASVRRTLRAAFALLALACAARPVAAHQFTSRFESPVPLPLVFAGAGATVAATALLLARMRAVPTFERRLLSLSLPVGDAVAAAARVGFLLAFVGVLVAGVTGPRAAAENFATLFAWSLWLKGLALLSVVFGTPWRTLSPWRTLYDALCRLEGGEIRLRSYPAVLGHWPALVGFFVLVGVAENLTRVPTLPRATAVVFAGYALSMLVGALLFGREWFERADVFEVFYGLLGRAAPSSVTREAGATAANRSTAGERGRWVVHLRAPWRACSTPVPTRTAAAFVVAMVYTVTFDGFAESPVYRGVYFGVREAFDVGASVSVVLYEAGLFAFLLGFVAVVAVAERVAAAGRRRVEGTGRPSATPTEADGGEPAGRAASRPPGASGTPAFAATLVPIAAGYEVAHNLGYVATTLGRLPTVVGAESVDPLWWLSTPAFWGSQVVFIVLGHVVAVVAAETVARRRAPTRRWALASHAPLVLLMVGYTVLSLWVVSLPVAN